MAVASTPNRKINFADEEKTKKSRSNCQAVGVVGEKIVDSQNGKTCHQKERVSFTSNGTISCGGHCLCRQKRMDFGPLCTSIKGNKECPIRLCHKCLLNRYGEKAEEVAMLNDWECPKCRGICNCSVCMKRRGQKPTGILIHAAKQNMFSVSPVKPENMGDYKMENTVDASPVNPSCPKKEMMVVSPRKPGKENSFDGNIDSKLDSHNTSLLSKKKKKKKKKEPENMGDYKMENTVDASPVKPSCPKKELMVVSPRNPGKKNYFDGNIDSKLDSHNASPLSKKKKKKKKEPENMGDYKMENTVDASPVKPSCPKKELMVVSPRNPWKKNYFSGNIDSKLDSHNTSPMSKKKKKKKPKKTKREGVEEVSNGNKDDDASLKKSGLKRCGTSGEVSKNELNSNGKDEGHSVKIRKSKKRKKEGLKEVSNDNNDDFASLQKSDRKKFRVPEEVSKTEANANGKDEGHSVKKRKSEKTKLEGLEKVSNGKGDNDATLKRISEEVSKSEVNSNGKDESHSVKKRKSKKTRRKGLKEVSDGNKDDDASLKKSDCKKCGISEEVSKNEVNSNGMDEDQSVKIRKSKKRKNEALKEVSNDNNDDDASLKKSDRKKCRIPEEVSKIEVNANGKDEGHSVKKRKSKKRKMEGPEKVNNGNGDNDASLKRISEEVSESEVNSNGRDEGHSVKKRKSKKTKRDGLKEVSDGNKDDDASLKKIDSKKYRTSEEVSKNEVNTSGKDGDHSVNKSKPRSESEDFSMEQMKKKEESGNVFVKNKESKKQSEKVSFVESKMDEGKEATTVVQGNLNSCNSEPQNMQTNTDLKLPLGTSLTTIACVELPPEDVGLALQFLEFCGCFGKIVALKKGQAEAVIREIINGRRVRRSQYSCIGQIHSQLLSRIQKDTGEVSPSSSPTSDQISWLRDLGKHVSKSLFISKELPPDCFDHGYEGYEKLNTSKKLSLLNFLCDEVLNTKELRNWINDQNSKLLEREKEAKGKIFAAKNKEKQLKQKMQDEVAKTILGKNGAPLTVSDHDAIVSQIKGQAAQAHAELLEAEGMLPRKEHRADAIRSDPIFVDDNGCVFWKLNCYNGRSDILLQDLKTWNMDELSEKWFVYGSKETEEIEKYISLKKSRLWAQNASTH